MLHAKPAPIFPPSGPGTFHHASSVVAFPNGEVLVAWYSGSYETSPDCRILLARGPHPWSAPQTLVDTPDRADGNPVLFLDRRGRLWLFYVTNYGSPVPPEDPSVKPWTYWTECKIHALLSQDLGRTWSPPRTIREAHGWMTRNHPLTLATGEILLPLYDEVKPSSTFMLSADEGATWREGGEILSEPGNEQPAVVQLSDGRLVALMRHRGTEGCVWRAESPDVARTWSAARPTGLPNPDAAVDALLLPNDVILLAFNNSPRLRTPLSLAASADAGQTWRLLADIETQPGEYSYPSLAVGADGSIHLTYTWQRRTIIHAAISADSLAAALA